MKRIIWIAILAAVAFLLLNKKKVMTFYTVLKDFLARHEGFSPYPYWDVRQWSWGYGTAAGFDFNNKPAGSITKEKAWLDAVNHVNRDYKTLSDKIKVQLSSNQWAALLSFSYNAGIGSALKLVPNINNNTVENLKKQWLSYNKRRDVSGVLKKNEGLDKRRRQEFDLFIS